MGYINFELLEEKGFEENDYVIFEVIKQLRTNPKAERTLSRVLTDRFLDKAWNEKLIYEIKGKKGDSELSKIRLTPKGNEVFEDIETPEVSNGDLEMFNYLSNMYLDSEDEERIIGNKKKTKMYCAIFRGRLGLSLHEMYWLCWLFLQRYKYTKKLENIFFDSNKNRYGKFENHLEDSPLYQFFDENKEEVKSLWAKKIKQ